MIPEVGHLPFFWSQPGAFDGLVYPHPREFAIKNANARGLARGGGWALLELTDALKENLRIDNKKSC